MLKENAHSAQLANRLHYTLRVASAMCFIGHGAFGIITKKKWLNYLALLGIGPAMGFHVMPWIGAFDILLGISLLVFPTRLALTSLVIWGAVTALLRPVSGEPFAEVMERAGIFGAPLPPLTICGEGQTLVECFARVSPDISMDAETSAKLLGSARVIVFMLLAGHGWLNLIGKSGLLAQYARLGFANPVQVAHIAGVFEILVVISVLVRPVRSILIGLVV